MTGFRRRASVACAVELVPIAIASAGEPEAAATPAPSDAGVATQPSEAASINRGRRLYTSYCTRCHGLSMVSVGSAFFDLRTFAHDDKPRFVESVTRGKRAMPAWGSQLSAAEIDHLWAYISSYQQ